MTVRKIGQTIKNWFMPVLSVFMLLTSVKFGLDTGAEVDVIDESTYDRLRNKPILSRCRTKLFPYGSNTPISTLGEFKTHVKCRDGNRAVKFIVTKGNNGNLMSYKTAVLLGLIAQIGNVDQIDKDTQKYAKRYKNLFSNKIGTLKNYQIKLHIKDSVRWYQCQSLVDQTKFD